MLDGIDNPIGREDPRKRNRTFVKTGTFIGCGNTIVLIGRDEDGPFIGVKDASLRHVQIGVYAKGSVPFSSRTNIDLYGGFRDRDILDPDRISHLACRLRRNGLEEVYVGPFELKIDEVFEDKGFSISIASERDFSVIEEGSVRDVRSLVKDYYARNARLRRV